MWRRLISALHLPLSFVRQTASEVSRMRALRPSEHVSNRGESCTGCGRSAVPSVRAVVITSQSLSVHQVLSHSFAVITLPFSTSIESTQGESGNEWLPARGSEYRLYGSSVSFLSISLLALRNDQLLRFRRHCAACISRGSASSLGFDSLPSRPREYTCIQHGDGYGLSRPQEYFVA